MASLSLLLLLLFTVAIDVGLLPEVGGDKLIPHNAPPIDMIRTDGGWVTFNLPNSFLYAVLFLEARVRASKWLSEPYASARRWQASPP